MEQKLSYNLEKLLREIELEIAKFVESNAFYLEFRNKCWAAGPTGQQLLLLHRIAINLRCDIDNLKSLGL
jgi:hypothetical protein